MAYETLIVAYDRFDRATEAVRASRLLRVPGADIKRHPVDAASIADIAAAPDEAKRLALHKRALDRGVTVISVRVMEYQADRVRAELGRYGPSDVAAAGQP